MGIVIDEKEAKMTPCVCYELKNGKTLCHTKGIVGFLSEEQKKTYCYGTYIRPAPPQMEKRLQEFAEQSQRCSQKVREEYKRGDRLMPFLDCMSEGGEE